MITSTDARKDLHDYFNYMKNTDVNLDKLIDIEEKYNCYGGSPEMVSIEISDHIKDK